MDGICDDIDDVLDMTNVAFATVGAIVVWMLGHSMGECDNECVGRLWRMRW